MKNTIKSISVRGYYYIVIIAVCLMTACNKKLNVLDENNPTQESYFNNAAELEEGVNAVYSSLRSGALVGREWYFLHDMRGSEFEAGGPQLEAPRMELLKQNTPSASNSVITNVWTGLYRMINRANLVISKAKDVKNDKDIVNRIVGEAKFLRAWAYFELVSQWGDVPVYVEPVTSSKEFKGLSPSDSVYSLIIKDLTFSCSNLPEKAAQKGRATRGAAYALLGRVEMQDGDYEAARTALLNDYGKYSISVPYLYNFDGDVKSGSKQLATGHEFNPESIFEVVFVDKGDGAFDWAYTSEGTNVAASTLRSQSYGIVWGNVIPSDNILDEFEPDDPRFKFTFYELGDKILTFGGTKPGEKLTKDEMNVTTSNHNGVIEKRVYRKYLVLDWVNDSNHPGGLNQRLIRYADVLLMLAECEAELKNPAKAADYINEVRSRPGVDMPPVSLNSKDEAIAAVMHERAVELSGEEVNNIDILRWRKMGYYPTIRPDPRPGQVDMLPIPASEISANPMIN